MLALAPNHHRPYDERTMTVRPMNVHPGSIEAAAPVSGNVFWTRPRAWMAVLLWCASFWAAVAYGIASMIG